MHLHPWYPASIWRPGTELFIFDSLTRLLSRTLHIMAGAGVDICPSGLPTISQLYAAVPSLLLGSNLTLSYSMKLRVTLHPALELQVWPWPDQSQQSIWHCAWIRDVHRTQDGRIMVILCKDSWGTTALFLLGWETMRLQIWASQ